MDYGWAGRVKEVGKNTYPVEASTGEEDRVLRLIKVLI